jgi:hypothetical protein
MTSLLTLACTVLLVGGSGSFTEAATPSSGDLRWARGAVAAVSPTSLTLQLADGVLTVSANASTEVITARPGVTVVPAGTPTGSLAVGNIVRVHYLDRQGRQAVVIMVDDATAAPFSRSTRTGTSVRGEVKNVKSRTVSVRIDRGSRDVILNDYTTLVDRDGRLRAGGAKAIAALVRAGADVLVTWVPFWVTDGEGAVTSYYRDAIEIRTLTPVSDAAILLSGSLRIRP